MKLIILVIIIVFLLYKKSNFVGAGVSNKYLLWIVLNSITLSKKQIDILMKALKFSNENYISTIKRTFKHSLNPSIITYNQKNPNLFKTTSTQQLNILKSNLLNTKLFLYFFGDIKYIDDLKNLKTGMTLDQTVATLKA
jgi:hypothetical protein